MKIERDDKFTFINLTEKEIKNLLVLELLRSNNVISRTEVSKDTGINMVSISNYIKSFLDKGLLYDKGPDVSTGGRKPELMELASGSAGVIGISVSGAEADMVLAALDLKAVAKRRAPVGDMAKAVGELSAAADSRRMKIKAIGVGLDGGKPPPALKDLKDAAQAPVFMGASVYCAAFGEKTAGSACGALRGDTLYMHSSLGEGIIMTGRELIGPSDKDKDGAEYMRPWGGRFSAIAMAREEVLKGVGTRIVHIAGADANKITEDSIVEAAKQGDEVALGIIESVAINLGLRTAYLVNIFAPRAVVVGGGMESSGETLLSGIKKIVARLSHASKSKEISILPSALGSDGITFGASALAVRELFLRA